MTADESPVWGGASDEGDLGRPWREASVDQLTPAHLEMRRVAASVRLIMERSLATGAPAETLRAVADELAAVAAIFDRLEPGGDFDGFAEAANAGFEIAGLYERSPIMGLANPLAPPIHIDELDGAIHAHGTFGTAYEGPPGCVHGGYIAAAFDEVLGATHSLAGNAGMTGTLTIRYRSPTPLHTELHFIGELDRVEGRKILTKGQLFAGDRLCAEAEGIFITVEVGRFATLMAERAARASSAAPDREGPAATST